MGTPSRMRTPSRTRPPSTTLSPPRMRTPSRSFSRTNPKVRSNYSVFFSHKIDDEAVTKSLIDLLARHTENVDFIISENIEKGKDWRQEIAARSRGGNSRTDAPLTEQAGENADDEP